MQAKSERAIGWTRLKKMHGLPSDREIFLKKMIFLAGHDNAPPR
jgi:hypothetical protein